MKGICFKEPLFKKTIEGTKTQTRRLMIISDCSESHKNYEDAEWKDEPMSITFNGVGAYCALCGNGVSPKNKYNGIKPKYRVGDIVYLKEPYYIADEFTYYRFDKERPETDKWENKLFMPESAARYFIEITGVRSERLQDISNDDCIKEGIYKHISHARVYWKNGYDGLMYQTPRDAYAWLINEINGTGTWESNPYVWVYEYEVK